MNPFFDVYIKNTLIWTLKNTLIFCCLISYLFVCFSPKSPPNSPNTELSIEDDLRGVYINYNKVKFSFKCDFIKITFI